MFFPAQPQHRLFWIDTQPGSHHQQLRQSEHRIVLSISFGNGTLNNLAGGVMNINSTLPFNNFGVGSFSLVRNSGVLNIDPAAAGTSGATVRIGGTDSIPFLNSGTINLISGSLSLGGGTHNTASGSTPADLLTSPVHLVRREPRP